MSRDSRVRYTKMVLQEALMTLLKQKSIDKITVTELCAYADLNRSTYYAYYDNPYDQLAHMEQDFFEELRFYTKQKTQNKSISDLEITVQYCRFYLKYSDLFLYICNGQKIMDYSRKTILAIQDLVYGLWSSLNYNDYTDLERDYALIYVQSGTIGMICKWLLEDKEKLSPEEIAKIILQNNNYGLRGK